MDPIAPEEFVAAVKGHPQGSIPCPSITGVSTDSRSIKPGDAFFALVGDRFDGHDYIEQVVAAGAAVIVASRREVASKAQASNWPVVFVDNTTAALGRLAGWYRKTLPARLIAVTGSNGKTTTKTMLEAVLSKIGKVISAPKSFNNNIGVPLTLLSADHTHNYIVLEMGTNHPGEIAELAALARPDLAVIMLDRPGPHGGPRRPRGRRPREDLPAGVRPRHGLCRRQYRRTDSAPLPPLRQVQDPPLRHQP